MVKLYWKAVYPILLYEVIGAAAFLLFASAGVLESTLIGAACSIPLFLVLYGMDVKRRRGTGEASGFTWKSAVLLILCGVGTCILVNNLLTISRLELIFPGVAQVNNALYAPSIWIQLLAMGFVIPIAEELIFRGLVFRRFRDIVSYRTAAWLSAALFGIFHGNLVQGIYALALGYMMAWVFEQFGTILAPVLFHMAANLCSVSFTWMMERFEVLNGAASFYIMTVLAGILVLISIRKIKQTHKEVLF